MRERKFRWFPFLAALFCCVLFATEELYARRGGRISFGRSRSYSRSASKASRAKSWGSSQANKPRLGGNRSGQAAQRASTTDRRVLDKARSQGTMYRSRNEATTAFQSKFGNQFPSKYSTQPATRPSHIPQRTTVNGQQYDVRYNPQYGGYGYMAGGGWRPYPPPGTGHRPVSRPGPTPRPTPRSRLPRASGRTRIGPLHPAASGRGAPDLPG